MEKILIIDDDKYYGETLDIILKGLNYNTVCTDSGESGKHLIKDFQPDLVITDLKMPNVSGIDVLEEAKRIDPGIQVLVLTAFEDLDTTIKAMQLGAYDYLEKNAGMEKLTIAVNRAVQSRRLSKKACLNVLKDDKEESFSPGLLIGRTPAMKEIFKNERR